MPWWNTENQSLQYAVLPPREINVTGTIVSTEMQTSIDSISPISSGENGVFSPYTTTENYTWKIIAAISATGWLITLIILYMRRDQEKRPPANSNNDGGESKCYQILMKACSSNDATGARKSFLSWAAARDHTVSILSISDAKNYFKDSRLDTALSDLEIKNYGNQTELWSGTELSAAVKRLRKGTKMSDQDGIDLALYPLSKN